MVSAAGQPARRALSIPDLLTFNGGYVDTAGFLALQGLFTAHVTGNFVTLGAALVQGSTGILAKMLALPVFCLVVVLVKLLSGHLDRFTRSALQALLGVKTVLFGAAAALALVYGPVRGPFANGDAPVAVLTGMVLVAAMAIQNAVHRIHFGKSPPTTLMTGSTTQIMMDVGDLLTGGQTPEQRQALRTRLASLGHSVLVFACGCALAALSFMHIGMKVFFLPVIVAFLTLLLRMRWPEPPAS
jgi:uncharacterized membrane protein YoaK (UPF0700 family)